MRPLTLAFSATAAMAVAAPALAADLTVSVEIPRINAAEYNRPYVSIWIERPDRTAVQTLAVWYQQRPNREGDGRDWLKDLRQWWRKGGNRLSFPIDGVSGPTRAPGRHTVTIPGARLRALPAGQYNLVVEAAREVGGREMVTIPFRWGAANAGRAAGSTELGAVALTVTR